MTTSRRARRVAAAVAAVAVAALVVAPWASDAPDGLARVARDHDFARSERSHALDDGPVAGYALDGVDDERAATGMATALGALATFGVALALFAALRARARRRARAERAP
ncbi:MAG TPA: PDGLE domain-containing protein [Actinomycetota bacterium]|nr:PDGLE domain-containing protein [Actinomycetota bacterium]